MNTKMMGGAHQGAKGFTKSGMMLRICFFCLFMFAFVPTSYKGQIFGVNRTILNWILISGTVILVGMLNKIDYRKMFVIEFLILIFMIFITIISTLQFGSAYVSIARIAPVLSLIFLFSIKIKYVVNFKNLEKVLSVFSIVAIVWNLGILFDNVTISQFTINNYNQYYDMVSYYSIEKYNKSVMSFGVHTYASYFYFIMFYLCMVSYAETKKKKFLIFSLFYIIFTVFLTSTTSLIFASIMALIFLKKIIKKPIFFVIIFIIGLIVLVANWTMLNERYLTVLSSQSNGFTSRYFGDNSVFVTNFKIISSSFGIGFNIIPELNLGYSDSGYVVLMTMGNLPLTITIYTMLYKFLKNNIPKKDFYMICFIIFSFEVALPSVMSVRFPFTIIFVICYLQSLENCANIRKQEENNNPNLNVERTKELTL